MRIKTVGIIGRGAVGVLYGTLLQEQLGKNQVCFIADENRTKHYREHPIHCNGQECDFHYVSSPDEFGIVDLLVIVVKYPFLGDALQSVRGFVGEHTIILSLLNGITSEGIVEETLGTGTVIHSIAQLMDAMKEGNQVSYTKAGEIVIGTNDEKKRPELDAVEELFRANAIPHHVAKDIIHEQWSKLVLNCGLNQVCAVYDVPYRDCQTPGDIRTLFIDTMEETRKIALLEGIDMKAEEIDQWLEKISGLSPDSMPSMRQDMLAGNKTEVDLFSKTIMELAQKHGVELTWNPMLYEKIKEKERNFS